jgi:hydrogenase maturation protease
MKAGSDSRPRILVAGIGNIFLGDDAFGVEVVRRLAARPVPDGVHVVEFGIRGLDLAYALVDGYDAAVLVDAAPRGGRPGTLYVIEPDVGDATGTATTVQAHNVDPVSVLRMAVMFGMPVRRLVLVGCEPQPMADAEDIQMEMSEPVRTAVDEAVPLVESLLAQLLRAEGPALTGVPQGDETNPVL